MRKTIIISILVLICLGVNVFAAGIDSDTKLMLHMDENPLVDSSLSGHSLSVTGVQRDNTYFKPIGK